MICLVLNLSTALLLLVGLELLALDSVFVSNLLPVQQTNCKQSSACTRQLDEREQE